MPHARNDARPRTVSSSRRPRGDRGQRRSGSHQRSPRPLAPRTVERLHPKRIRQRQAPLSVGREPVRLSGTRRLARSPAMIALNRRSVPTRRRNEESGATSRRGRAARRLWRRAPSCGRSRSSPSAPSVIRCRHLGSRSARGLLRDGVRRLRPRNASASTQDAINV